ncbi:hypothetical protein AYO21_04072 [Fonsecaea monophora]|uniref:Uncharacterized protein n=1 Tax=Fonsecaea monophora TaxID=254056 RepID=A0A177FBV4_9EURO|nr:hypothetical protein AYO21_04072 [Fonsecaea monophora]OAG41608.1 hypothetical protein AYO21_04072 [Fonsecaea monophora]
MATEQPFRFTVDDFAEALADLDGEIGKSKNLGKIAPVRLLSAGGFVAVSHLGNRSATEDIDYIIDPNIENLGKIKEKLQKAIRTVADKRKISEEWINAHMEVFAVGGTKMRLFQESIEQQVILWHGKNLVIYAVKWEWSLARKLKRIGSERREVDINDAVAILKIMVDQKGGPLERETMKGWNSIIYTPIEDSVLDIVAAGFSAKYGVPGIV